MDTYTLQQLHEAQAKLRPLVESKQPGTQQHEFYDAMLNAMYALDLAMREFGRTSRALDFMDRRIAILEKLLSINIQLDIDAGK